MVTTLTWPDEPPLRALGEHQQTASVVGNSRIRRTGIAIVNTFFCAPQRALGTGACAPGTGRDQPTTASLLTALTTLATASSCTTAPTTPTDAITTLCTPPWTSEAPPPAGQQAVISLQLPPPCQAASAGDRTPLSATVGGQNVTSSWASAGNFTYTVTYVTEAGGEEWPWSGLEVEVAAVDGCGVVSHVLATLVPGSTWSEGSEHVGMAGLEDNNGRGVCVGDFDADGDVDVFSTVRFGGSNQLWVNNGSGVFSNGAAAWGLKGFPDCPARGCGFGDADGDGLLDLIVTCFEADDNDLFMNRGDTFVEEGGPRGVSSGVNSLGVSWGDVDGDGDVDLFVCSQEAVASALFVNDGGGVFTDQAAARGVTNSAASRQSALVDIDDDGDLDLLLVNDGPNALYENGGTGGFSDETASWGFGADGSFLGLAIGDWNGDGVVDVYVTNSAGRDLLYVNAGGMLEEVGVAAGIDLQPGGRRGVSMVDFENDGDVDVVVVANVASESVAWLNSGGGRAQHATALLPLGLGNAVASVDFDGDGDVDVLVSRGGAVVQNHNARPGLGLGRVVVVRPLTTAGAPSAFGASVRLECVAGCGSPWVGVRVIDGGSSYYSQNGYDAVIGVPVPGGVYNGSVRWAGDVHPVSNWMTHPRLGGVVPSTLSSTADRLRIVRQAPVALRVEALPWDFPGVTSRVGEGSSAPRPGDVQTVTVTLQPSVNVADVVLLSATVSGQDVTSSWGSAGNGAFEVTYVTEVGGEEWPWSGLEVEVVVVDGCGVVSSVSWLGVVGSTWSEESGAAGMTAFQTVDTRGVCVGDFDADGDVDVFTPLLSSGSNQLWVNGGSGDFSNEATSWGLLGAPDCSPRGCGFGDADGDGLLDLIVTCVDRDVNQLYMNRGDTFVEEGGPRGVSSGVNSLGVSWGDVDGDGDVDVFVCSQEAVASALFVNDGGGVFTDQAAARGVANLGASRQSALVDIDDDGDLDLLLVNDGPNALYENGGTGGFSDETASWGFGADGNFVGLAIGDWNGDGVVDVYVTSLEDRDLLYVNAGGMLEEVGVATGVDGAPGAHSRGVSMADFENDGDVDIAVTGSSWINQGDGVFTAGWHTLAIGTATFGLATGDVDGDGDVDVLVSGPGEVVKNHNAQLGLGRVVVVRPLTTAGAPSAFGASVRLECVAGCGSPWVGVRVIDGGSSYYSQNGYDAVIGVPVPGGVYNGSVRWAGDVHPVSNWMTHPRLGGVVPSTLSSTADRLIVVRPAALLLSLGEVHPWDYAAVATRTGDPAPPPSDTTTLIPVTLRAPAYDLTATAATVNSQNVLHTFTHTSPAEFTLLYTTLSGQQTWPWSGLRIVLSVIDSGGLVSTLDEYLVPGTTVEETFASTGLATIAGGRGLCMADLDGDGLVDVFLTSAAGHHAFFNAGGGVFADRTTALNLSPSFDGAGCGAADFDDDGDLDVFVVAFDVATHQLLAQDGGNFVDLGASRGLTTPVEEGRSLALGDIDGDGDVDVFVCAIRANQLLLNDAGVFHLAVSATNAATHCRASAMFDADGDTDLDIAVVTAAVPNEFYVNTGGAFLERGDNRGFASPLAAVGLAAGDLTGDGWPDVVVALSDSDEAEALFVNTGGGVFVEEGAKRGFGAVLGSNFGMHLVDFDNDGDLDMLFAGSTDVLYVNSGGVFADRSTALGLTLVATSYGATGDIDGDGDVDIVQAAKVYLNHNAGHGRANWVVVRPLSAAGAPSAYGAAVRLECVVGCEERPWGAVRMIVSTSGNCNMPMYDAHFGLPAWGAAFDVEVVFVGGATHDKGTDGELGGVVGGSVVTVVDRPYLEGVVGVFVGQEAGLVGVGDSVVVVLIAGRRRTDLVPGEGCCFVNGVQVADSFAGGGDGTYNLTYVVGEGDGEWGSGELAVVPTLMSAGRNLSMVEVGYDVGGGIGGDPVSPVVVFGCRPRVASANVWEELCVACAGEGSCHFSYAVESTSLVLVEAEVGAKNYTGAAAATFSVGPFNDADVAAVTVFAVDGAGNWNASERLVWRVDTSSPVTTLVEKPDTVTQRTGATFTLQCSEASCSFAYVFDGGLLTALGGNGTEGGGNVPFVETWVVGAPLRVSNESAPVVLFAVTASQEDMLVNATVEVSLGSRRWTLAVVGDVTEALQLPVLGDGRYLVTGAGRSGAGVADVTPVAYAFEVDTQPPRAVILDAPEDGEGRALPPVFVGADEEDCVFVWRAGPLPLNSSWQTSEVGFLYPEVTGGEEHRFEVFAVDTAGNAGGVVAVTWVPAVCPTVVPDVSVTSSWGLGVGHRYVTFEGAGEVDVFEYRLDGGSWVATTKGRAAVSNVGLGAEHVMEVRAGVPGVCNGRLAGTRPPPQQVTWVEPAPLPLAVEIVGAPDSVTPDVFAEFTLAPSRRLAWLEYSLDGEAWTPCGEVLVVGPLQAGEHVLRVRAVDRRGDGSGGVESHTWAITAASDSSIVLSGLPDGEHSLTVIATDAAGSVEVAPQTFTWRVDSTPPVVSGNRTSPQFSTSRTAVVEVACAGETDPCTFCWTSSTVPANCSDVSPVLLVAPEDGDHAADVRAVDNVGLVSEGSVGVVWTVDSTPPTVNVSDIDAVFATPLFDAESVDVVVGVPSLRLGVAADEEVGGYVVELGGKEWPAEGAWLAPGPVLEFTGLQSVINEISVAGVDLSGNVGVAVLLSVLVDVTPPVATLFTSVLPALTKESSLDVGVGCVDTVGGSGVREILVFVDGVAVGAAASGAGMVAVSGLTTGVYNVSATGVDVAGNVDGVHAWRLVEVDQLPPVSFFAADPPAHHGSPSLTVLLGANEDATLLGRVVGKTGWLPANASGVVTFDGLPDGAHVVEVRAVDVAGNEEGEPYTSAPVVVDTEAPVLLWTTSPALYTSNPLAVGCFVVNDSTSVALSVQPASAELQPEGCFAFDVFEDGVAGVNVTGVDAAGNVGEVLRVDWVLDRAPPGVVVEAAVSASAGCVHAGGGVTVCSAVDSATAELGCGDGGVAVDVAPCRPQYVMVLEEAAVAAGCAVSSPGSARRLADGFEDAPLGTFTLESREGDGLYAVAVRAVDAAGNVEVGNVTMWWYVDTADPVRPVFAQSPDAMVSTTTALFVVQLEGDNSPGQTTFWYSLDDEASVVVGELPVDVSDDVQLELSGLVSGNHKVEVWAVDQGGNVGPSVLHNWQVVTEAPSVVILEQPALVSGDVTPSFVFAARWVDRPPNNRSELAAGVEVSLNGAAEYTEVCVDTVASGGFCVWSASLAETGVGPYTINVRASLAGTVGDPTPFAWSYTLCDDDQFAEVGADGGILCVGCPVGGNCAGGLTGQADIAAVQGFWAPEGSSGLRFYECPVEEACLPGGDVVVGNATVRVVGQCAEGYKGTLCAVCEDGFFEQFGLCMSCGTQSGVAWVIMFAVLVAVIGIGVLFFKFREFMPIDQLKVTLSMVQIIASANTAYAIPWPPLFADFLNTLRVFLIEAVSLTRANCAQPMTFYGSLVVTLVGFKVVLAVIVLGPVVWHKWRRRGRTSLKPAQASPAPHPRRRTSVLEAVVAGVKMVQAVDWVKIFKITFLFLFVAYPGASLKIMKIFKCVEVEGDFWLVADMRLRCYEGDWFGYALYAFVMGCLYTGGLPLAITVILWRNRRKLGEAGVVAKWGFLYETYGVGAYLWEVVELLRKLWLSALVVLMKEGSPLQVTVAVLISGWAHVLHAVYKPWRGVGEGGSKVYALQHGSLLVTFFVFLMGLLFKVEGVSQDSTVFTFLAWAMLLACAGFLVAASFVLFMAGTALLRASRARQPGSGGGKAPDVPAAAQQRVTADPHTVRKEDSLTWVGNPLRSMRLVDAKGRV